MILSYHSWVQWCVSVFWVSLSNGRRWPFPHFGKQGCLIKTGVRNSDFHDFKSHLLRARCMESLVVNVGFKTAFLDEELRRWGSGGPALREELCGV